MAMYVEEIAARAASLSGESSEGLAPFAATAEAMLRVRLREGVDPEEIRDLYVAAGALMALAVRESAGGEIDWTAGAVSVSRRGSGGAAALMAEAGALLAGYTRDGDFCFLGVDG